MSHFDHTLWGIRFMVVTIVALAVAIAALVLLLVTR